MNEHAHALLQLLTLRVYHQADDKAVYTGSNHLYVMSKAVNIRGRRRLWHSGTCLASQAWKGMQRAKEVLGNLVA